MRYIVTGGAGFVGSNLAFALSREAGARVAVVDDFSSGHFKNLAGFGGDVIAESVAGDSWHSVAGAADAIFHEAAITDTTVHDPMKMMRANVEGFRSVLVCAKRYKVRRIVYASSAGVYGNGACPMSESSDPSPENIYGFSKAIMDNVAAEFAARNKKYTLVGLRYFNVYGCGESHKGAAASMIYQLYLQMKAGKKPRVFRSGEQERDFVYVKDVVRANILALKAKKSCVVNVATGKPESFNRIIELLNKNMGLSLETEYFDNPYDFYQNKTQADVRLAAKNIGFRAAFSLEKGIADYVKILSAGKKG